MTSSPVMENCITCFFFLEWEKDRKRDFEGDINLSEALWPCGCHPARKARHRPPGPEVQKHPGEEELQLCHRWPGTSRPSRLRIRHHWHCTQSEGRHQEVRVVRNFRRRQRSGVFCHPSLLTCSHVVVDLAGIWLRKCWTRPSTQDTLIRLSAPTSMLWAWFTGKLHAAAIVEVRLSFFHSR